MKVHLIGIGGTGMGAVAGLLAAAGHEVRGSDTAVYPPMSDQLAALGVPVMQGYAAANLDWTPDVVVVGNVHGKDHPEVAAAQARGLTLTSFPAVLGEQFLTTRHSIVVAGTHGKTTTTSLLGHILETAGRDPGLFVGGVPLALGQGWQLGTGDFVVEGDEYDTAFFDKGSKFLHYRPRSVILTSVELDHVDIFASLAQVHAAFAGFIAKVPTDGVIVVCADAPDAVALAKRAACAVELYQVVDAPVGEAVTVPPDVTWWASGLEVLKSGRVAFDVYRRAERLERFETVLVGRHNVSNCLAAIAIAVHRGVPLEQIRAGVSSFAGVKRRQELRGIAGGVSVFDDYAHHPTAVRETLRAMRQRFPKRKLIAAYEPRSATSRRRTFQHDFATAFALADAVFIGQLFDTSKIPEADRFDPDQLALDLHRAGTSALNVPDVGDMVRHLVQIAAPGDVVVAFSSGSFDGLHDRLLDALGDPIRPAKREDLPAICELLARCGVSQAGTDLAYAPAFFKLSNERGLVGSVALDVLGTDGVLRALAIDPDCRGTGYGWMLADTAITWARFRGVRRIYLTTDSASDFFGAKFGFRVIDRSTVSASVAASPMFVDPASAHHVAMRLDL